MEVVSEIERCSELVPKGGKGCRLMGRRRRPLSRRHRRPAPATRTGHKSPGSSDHAALPRSLNAGSGHDAERSGASPEGILERFIENVL